MLFWGVYILDEKKIKMLMIKRGMSQKDLRDRTMLSKGLISMILSGKNTNVRINTARRIAYALDVRVDDILTDDEHSK